jgi:hypothetical protein
LLTGLPPTANNEAPGVVLCVRRGALGHPIRALLALDDLTLVGALEDPNELGRVIFQVGAVTLCTLLGYDMTATTTDGKPAASVKGLMEHLANWAKLDIEALKKELAAQAEEDNAAAEAPPAFVGTVDELEKHLEETDARAGQPG